MALSTEWVALKTGQSGSGGVGYSSLPINASAVRVAAYVITIWYSSFYFLYSLFVYNIEQKKDIQWMDIIHCYIPFIFYFILTLNTILNNPIKPNTITPSREPLLLFTTVGTVALRVLK